MVPESLTLETRTHQAPVLVDAHVHLYPCFDLADAFASAWRNFSAYAWDREFQGYLLLTETWRDEAFRDLATRGERGGIVESARGGKWEVKPTREPESLEVVSDSGRRLFLVAGRQVQTSEGLEVLVAGTLDAPRDGVSLPQAVESARSADAIPVIPWGFGKWWGRRGRLLTRYLSGAQGELFLGDNGGRPAGYGEPIHFRQARRRAIPVLPGSDPLPLASQTDRLGSFGFGIEGRVDRERPGFWLKARIRSGSFVPRPFGKTESPLRFARHQVVMQFRKQRSH